MGRQLFVAKCGTMLVLRKGLATRQTQGYSINNGEPPTEKQMSQVMDVLRTYTWPSMAWSTVLQSTGPGGAARFREKMSTMWLFCRLDENYEESNEFGVVTP